MASSFRVAFRKEITWIRDDDSVWTMETTIPARKPKVTKRCSSYAKRSSSKVKVGPSNTLGASTKSRPCSDRFGRRFLSSQENRIGMVYIHGSYASTRQGSALTTELSGRPRCRLHAEP